MSIGKPNGCINYSRWNTQNDNRQSKFFLVRRCQKTHTSGIILAWSNNGFSLPLLQTLLSAKSISSSLPCSVLRWRPRRTGETKPTTLFLGLKFGAALTVGYARSGRGPSLKILCFRFLPKRNLLEDNRRQRSAWCSQLL